MLKLNWFNSKKHTQTRFIEINKTYFKVQNHWFWIEYDKTGWEPQTYNIFKQFVSPDAVYIDVGTWVGMTIFFAAELGYKQIYGIEANPESFAIVKQNCAYNKSTLSADLSNLCVTNAHLPRRVLEGTIGKFHQQNSPPLLKTKTYSGKN